MSNVTTLIVVGAVMFAVLGGVTLLSHIYSLNSIKSRTVGDGQHGTARWATKREIRKTYKHIPFTPDKWRKQAKSGQEPTASVVHLRPLFSKKDIVLYQIFIRQFARGHSCLSDGRSEAAKHRQ